MAKDLSKHQKGIVKRYYEHHETIQSNKLSEIVSELWLAEDEKSRVKLWGRAQVALTRLAIDAARVANVVDKRDLEGLAKLAAQADSGMAPQQGSTATPAPSVSPRSRATSPADGRTVGQMLADKAADGGYDSMEEKNLKRALQRFRKKIKTMRRDDESRLGNRYVTSGRTSDIAAITPPSEFPMVVWHELVKQGRLKNAGQGTFQLP